MIPFWERLAAYDWPGNIQELRGTMEYVVNISGNPSELRADLLPTRIVPSASSTALPSFNLEQAEQALIRQALAYRKEKHISNEELAHMLGIGTATLYRKIKKYGLVL